MAIFKLLLITKKATQKNKIDIEANNQYGRRNNIVISGIPNEVSDEQLEEKVKEVLSKAGIDKILDNDIEACHRLPATRNNKNKKTIVRFVNRKKSEKCLKNKKKLSSLNMDSVNFPKETKIFISENLNRHFSKIAWECRKLKRERLIHSFKFQNEAFIIKCDTGDTRPLKINDVHTLYLNFPGFFVDELIES